MNPTDTQLQSRLNPTPVSITIPGEPFRSDGPTNDTINVVKDGKLYSLNVNSLAIQEAIKKGTAVLGPNGYSGSFFSLPANQRLQIGIDALKNQYGIDWNSIQTIPEGQIADLMGLVRDGKITPGGDLNQDPTLLKNLFSQSSGTNNSATPTTMNKNIQPPSVNLQPGSTDTTAVKQLQDYLVANGYMTEAQKNTGYGIYGSQTTAAVQALQQKLGVNAGSAPGYWGPKTMAAITTAGTVPSGGITVNTTGTGTSTGNASMSAQKALLTAIADVAESAASTGKPPVSFAEALDLAGKDPTIMAKYADMAKMDLQSFTQSLEQLKTASSLETDQKKIQFENERKNLAENMAAAGTAYSGFRGKAQEDLAKTEAGIVTSSRSQLKNNLNNLTSAFEAKYGTGATPTPEVAFNDPTKTVTIGLSGLQTTPSVSGDLITGEKAGGITGTVEPEKKADILSSALNSYNATAFPAV